MLRTSATALALALIAGCFGGTPERLATVSGRVTLAGEPVPGGRLLIQSLAPEAQVQQTVALLNPDGTYIATEVPVGPVVLALDTEYVRTEILPDPEATIGGFKYRPLPQRYRAFESAELGFEVRPGSQTRDIALEP
jgi:hypothetical protein